MVGGEAAVEEVFSVLGVLDRRLTVHSGWRLDLNISAKSEWMVRFTITRCSE